jgi:phosphatidylglycerol:prolipoprotein diacylglycerol transferase
MALEHPHIDPVAVSLGHWHVFGHDFAPAIHWYGLTYMVAFGLFVLLAGRRSAYPWFAREGWVRRDVEDLLFYGVLGVVLGGRLGYVIFYKPLYYADHLREIVAVWNGGMSFHGGMLGVIVAMAFFAWQRKRPFLQVTDLIAPCVPLGLASGRVGNFINGELWGRVADPSLPWAMVFPESGNLQPRHPSQIYQFLGEGIALFVILWIFGKKERGRGEVSGLFLIGYGFFRFVAEYFRAPDDFIGDKTTLVGDPTTHLLTFGWSEGQWLCVPMVIVGVLMFLWGRRQARGAAPATA